MTVVAGYFTSWGMYKTPPYTPFQIPVEHLTHVNYAFANLSKSGIIEYSDKWADAECSHHPDFKGSIELLNNPASPIRQKNPNFRSLISIGGWTFSKYFSVAARTPESRTKFVASVINFIKENKFDGVDIDWEYPVDGGMPENLYYKSDKENFGFLLNQLRIELDIYSKINNISPLLLTAAVSSSLYHIDNLDVLALANNCDWVNVMTYDAFGSWSSKIGHHSSISPLAKNTVEEFVSRGLPKNKIALGIPFYGRGFSGVTKPEVGSNFKNVSNGTSEAGIVEFDDLIKNYNHETGYTSTFDPEARSCVYWNEEKRVWISGEDDKSVAAKTKWAKENGLAGVFFWELSMDCDNHLLNAINSSILSPKE